MRSDQWGNSEQSSVHQLDTLCHEWGLICNPAAFSLRLRESAIYAEGVDEFRVEFYPGFRHHFSYFTSLENFLYSNSISSGVVGPETINTRYLKVTDCLGSSVKFNFSLPLLKTSWPRGFAANRP